MPADYRLISDVRDWLVDQQQPVSAGNVASAVRSSGTVVGPGQLFDLVSELRAELRGAGPLEQLLRRGEVTDVLVNGPSQVWIDGGEGMAPVASPFRCEEDVRRLAQRLATLAGRRIDTANPFCDARLPDGTRFHAALAPLAHPGTLISLRLPPRRGFALADLVERGAVSPAGARWLRALIAARVTFLVSGGTGSGKTTVLGALLGLVADHERLLVLEDSAELRPAVGHLCALQGRPPNVEGAGEVRLVDLVRQSLRMRPDRIVVGEVRGPEIVDMLAAFNTGHDGGAGTIHARTASLVPTRVEALALAAGLDRRAAHAQLAAGVDAVLHVARDDTGRRISQLAELVRSDDGWCAVRPVLEFGAQAVVREPDSPLIAVLREHLC